MSKQYSHTNSKGVTYYLNMKMVTLRGGKRMPIYYFTKAKYTNSDTAVEELPDFLEIRENPRNGFLSVVRKGSDAPAPANLAEEEDLEEED